MATDKVSNALEGALRILVNASSFEQRAFLAMTQLAQLTDADLADSRYRSRIEALREQYAALTGHGTYRVDQEKVTAAAQQIAPAIYELACDCIKRGGAT